jgi:hypothetical protein
MTPGELAARYRCYAIRCLLIEKHQFNVSDRAALADIAKALASLADYAEKNGSVIAPLEAPSFEQHRCRRRVQGNKEPAMTDDRGQTAPTIEGTKKGGVVSRSRPADQHLYAVTGPDVAELRRIVIRKIAHHLNMFYAAETKLSPRLEAFVQRLDEQQERSQ